MSPARFDLTPSVVCGAQRCALGWEPGGLKYRVGSFGMLFVVEQLGPRMVPWVGRAVHCRSKHIALIIGNLSQWWTRRQLAEVWKRSEQLTGFVCGWNGTPPTDPPPKSIKVQAEISYVCAALLRCANEV
eukprot:4939446-Amphidinium_carterae.1